MNSVREMHRVSLGLVATVGAPWLIAAGPGASALFIV